MQIKTLDDFLNLLEKVKPVKGNEYQARCPAHDDKNPSLSVTESDGRILVHCHAGCSYKEIINALGLRDGDLFLDNDNLDPPTNSKIIQTYDYNDEEGNLLYQVIKTEDKDFFQRKPTADGWEWGRKPVEAVLYRLPDVKKAIKEGCWLLLPEGEKDCDNLRQLGFKATTNLQGAGEWKDKYSDELEGANVVILPDNDTKSNNFEGQKHALTVAESLQDKANQVRILELPDLPPKGDVSDWIRNGGSKEKLKELVEEKALKAEEWAPGMPDNHKREKEGQKPQIERFSDIDTEEIEWVWAPYIPKSKVTILAGHPGVGKTFIALMIAARISQGEEFLTPGKDVTEPEPVLYMTAEDGLGDTLKPRLEAMDADHRNIYSLRFKVDEESGEKRFVSFKDDLEYISKAINQIKPVLVVVDPLQGFIGSEVNTHKASEVRPVLAALSDVAEEHNTGILVITHLTKSSRNNSLSRILGSVDFTAHARSVLFAGEDSNVDGKFALTQRKSNLADTGPSQGYELADNKLIWTGETEIDSADIVAPEQSKDEKSAKEEAMEFLEAYLSEGAVYNKEVKDEAKELDISDRTLRRAREDLGVESEWRGREVWWKLPGDNGEVVPF